jgi:hypothetical protein
MPLRVRVDVEAVGTDTTEDTMKNTPQTYVLTLNSPSRKALRLWTGKNIHALRHCSVKQIGHALMEMQQYLEDLQAPVQVPGASYSLNRSR